jgi:catechol 2,3-dioxygenase-like lactoylglutathione lyase family enzyme
MGTLTEPRWTHVALPVSDIDRSIEFYESVTPLVLVQRNEDANGRGAWLSNKGQVDSPFVLVLAEFNPDVAVRFDITPGSKIPTLAPFAHIGIELPNREDVDRVADAARAVGALRWEPMEMAAHIGYICAVNDPDGNTIEFSHNQKVYSTIQELWG